MVKSTRDLKNLPLTIQYASNTKYYSNISALHHPQLVEFVCRGRVRVDVLCLYLTPPPLHQMKTVKKEEEEEEVRASNGVR